MVVLLLVYVQLCLIQLPSLPQGFPVSKIRGGPWLGSRQPNSSSHHCVTSTLSSLTAGQTFFRQALKDGRCHKLQSWIKKWPKAMPVSMSTFRPLEPSVFSLNRDVPVSGLQNCLGMHDGTGKHGLQCPGMEGEYRDRRGREGGHLMGWTLVNLCVQWNLSCKQGERPGQCTLAVTFH